MRQEDYINEFFEFLSIPSISALPQHKGDMEKAALWVEKRLRKAGVGHVEIISTPGHPVVYGLAEARDANAPTVLLYGHYDTQPADPLDEWISPPFEPEIREDKIYARGAADDKGGIFPAILAAQDMIKGQGLPVNLKFLFEGEEEIGSPNLKEVLKERQDSLGCDLVVSVDGGMFSKDIPSLTVGCKGLSAIQIDVQGPKSDVHSGGQGGLLQNPIHALVEIVAGMKAPSGKITVDGFYDDVVISSPEEKQAMAQVGLDEKAHAQYHGVPELFGEEGYTAIERAWVRPTLDANGIWGGFQGDGIKTIIPARASCKITCRLVPNQDPDAVCSLLEEHVKRHVPKGVTVDITVFPGNSKPYVVPSDHPVLPVMARVMENLYGQKPVTVRLGGTLPIARAFLDTLGVYLVFFATSSPDSGAHGPNEFYRIDEFKRLRKGLPLLLQELAGVLKK